MLASFPASMLNQKRSDLGILNRFSLNPSRFSTLIEYDLFGKPLRTFRIMPQQVN
jgi:hypothetical protein